MHEEEIQLEKAKEALTIELLQKILQNSKNDSTITILDIKIEFATKKGDNYASNMFRIFIQFRKREKEEIEVEQFIAKFVPILEGQFKEYISKCTFFDTEINMLTDTLPKMNKLLGPDNRISGRCFYSQSKDLTFLVIEDLQPLGFRMASNNPSFDIEHILLAIRGLARFHASSVAVCEKEPHLKKLYSKGMFCKEQPPEINMFFGVPMKRLAVDMVSWSVEARSYADKISKLAENIYERACALALYKENEFNVINHGDFWINNLLFSYDVTGRPKQQIFVDFQECRYSSPALDLQCFFHCSMTDEVLVSYEKNLLTEYWRTLNETMIGLECKTMPPTLIALETIMAECSLFGLIVSCVFLPGFFQNDAIEADEILEGSQIINPGFSNSFFRQSLLSKLKRFEALGLFKQ